jgi:diacylglycerol kinase family enzyme
VAWTLIASHTEKQRVLYRRVRNVDVVTAGLPVQLDGDYVGETPVRFSVRPGALTVCLPAATHFPFLAHG